MSVVISSSLTITDTESGGGTITANNPLIGWRNLVTKTNVSATTAASGFPVTNLANPSTNLRWKGVEASPAVDELLTFNLQTSDQIDYIAVARHNFGSAEIPVSVEVEDLNASPVAWVEVISDTLLPDDGPALFRFTPQGVTKIRIRMKPGTAAPTAAVVYCGKLLVVQRRIYVGHTPINYGRQTSIANGVSQSGNFLGRIKIGETKQTSINLQNLNPAWYRTNIEPFIQQAQTEPFFMAWRPSDYPNEVGYVWLTNDPQPSNQLANGMMEVGFEMAGVV